MISMFTPLSLIYKNTLFAPLSLLSICFFTTVYIILMILLISAMCRAVTLSCPWQWIAVSAISVILCCLMVGHFRVQIMNDYREIAPIDSWPFVFYLLPIPVLLGLASWEFQKIEHWRSCHISAASIQEGLDCLETGLCYSLTDGRVLLQNRSMDRIMRALTGSDVRDALALWRSVESQAVQKTDHLCLLSLKDGRWIQFRKGNIVIGNLKGCEITASDVSEQIRLNKDLELQNQELDQGNRWLQDYHSRIDEVIREQEILNTRIQIHDDLGEILLLTRYSLEKRNDEQLQEEVINMWEENAKMVSAGLLEREANRREKYVDRDGMNSLRQAAQLAGLSLEYHGNAINEDGSLTVTAPRILEIYRIALHECMTNTILHGNGHTLYVEANRELGQSVRIIITNDGILPKKPIQEGGGLMNLRKKIEQIGGSMELVYTEHFGISIVV